MSMGVHSLKYLSSHFQTFEMKHCALDLQGNYTLVEEMVNGFPYWLKDDGGKTEEAIWSFYSYVWMIGFAEEVGSTTGVIGVEFESDVWLTQILDGYLKYDHHQPYETRWQPTNITFKDCK